MKSRRCFWIASFTAHASVSAAFRSGTVFSWQGASRLYGGRLAGRAGRVPIGCSDGVAEQLAARRRRRRVAGGDELSPPPGLEARVLAVAVEVLRLAGEPTSCVCQNSL